MAYLFPFGQELHPLIQQDQTPKQVFVLGVYASAEHARQIGALGAHSEKWHDMHLKWEQKRKI